MGSEEEELFVNQEYQESRFESMKSQGFALFQSELFQYSRDWFLQECERIESELKKKGIMLQEEKLTQNKEHLGLL